MTNPVGFRQLRLRNVSEKELSGLTADWELDSPTYCTIRHKLQQHR